MTHTRVGHAFLPFVHEGWSYQHPDSVNDTLLGEGGFGTVFLMRRRNGSVVENVAVKLIKRSRKPDKLVPADEDEFILMKKLDIGHPNLLPPLATLEIPLIDPTKRRLAIVTEHCALGNLETILKKGPYLPEYSKPALLKAITSGLVALHSRDISHRDIKLQNIVVTREGVPKICDLGLAKFSKSGVMDSNVGTEGYKPPEIYRGPYSGPLADVFSLAIVFIAVLTGHDFSCIKLGFDNEAFLMKKVQSQPKLSNFWKTVLQGMLTFDTSKRFSSAEVLKRIEAQYPMSRTVVFEQIPITPGPFDDWKSTTSWSSDSDSLEPPPDCCALWREKANKNICQLARVSSPSPPLEVIPRAVSPLVHETTPEPALIPSHPPSPKKLSPHSWIRPPGDMPSKVATTSPLSVVSPSTSTPTILTTSTTSNTTTSSATSSTKPSPPSVTQKPLITPITPRAPSVGVLLPNIVPEEVSSQLQLVTGLFRDLARSDCTTDWGTCARIISHWLQLFSIDSTTETLENGCDLSDALRYMYPCAKITPVRRCSHLFHAVSNWAQLLDALHSELHIKIVNLFADDLAAGVNSRKQIVSVARLLMNLHLITLKALL